MQLLSLLVPSVHCGTGILHDGSNDGFTCSQVFQTGGPLAVHFFFFF